MTENQTHTHKPTQNPSERIRFRKRFEVPLRHLKKYRKYLIVGALSVTLSAVFNVVRPYLIKLLLDDLENGTLHNHGIGLAGAFVGLTALSGLFLFVNRRSVIWMSRKLEYDIRGELFKKLLRLPMSFYHQRRVGDVMARLTNDVEAVRLIFGPGIMYFTNTIMTTTLSLALMFYMAPKLTLYVIIPMPIISILVTLVGGMIHKRFNAIQRQFSVLTATAQENLSGIRVVKAYGQELSEIERFKKVGREYAERNMSLARFQGIFMPLLYGMAGMITLIALYVGGQQVIDGEITKGDLVSFFVYIGMLIWPIIALGWVVSLYQRGSASLDRLNKIFHAPEEWPVGAADDITQPDEPSAGQSSYGKKAPTLNGKIEFRNLTFTYDTPPSDAVESGEEKTRDQQFAPALRNISLCIEPGTSLGIIGPVAAGKTTLAALVMRLYQPPRGALFVDNRDILDWPLAELREQIGYVPQESFLFSDKLRENIRFGAPDATDDAVYSAVKAAALEQDIAEFPGAYDTIVGERGITLSGGQKQRLSIARAVLTDPRIIILDDATSAVDTETEAKITSGLYEMLQGRTSIIISHRISAVKECSQIIYLDEGQIIERGKHRELLAAGGPYAELYHLQSLKEQLEVE